MSLNVLAIEAGFVLMIAGSYVAIWGASEVGRKFGVSEMVIGATIVALGTSLPELITVVVASFQGRHEIGLGNIVGSNIINVIGILGLGVLILPISVKGLDGRGGASTTTIIDFVLASLYLLYCLLFRKQIGRMDGLILVTGFVLYSWLSYTIKPAS